MMQSSRKMLANSIQLLQQSKGEDDEAQKIEETIQRLKAVIKQIEEQEDKFGEN
jgi:seryl-tRNA synthetase